MLSNRTIPATILTICALSCDAGEADTSDDGVIEPVLDGKSDELGGVDDRGELTFGATADASFDEDFQFFGYTFEARENAVVDIEVTQAGSSQGLDTTLFVYRLSDDAEPKRIAFDDDTGFGALSKLSDFRLFTEGRYAIVVGTKGAEGRGKFRLSLQCGSEACEPVAPPDTACPEAMQRSIAACLDEVSADSNLEASFDVLVGETCGTEEELEGMRDELCVSDGQPFCDGDAAIEACGDFVTTAYPAANRIASVLTETEHAAMTALEDAVNTSEFCGELGEDAGCHFEGAIFTHAPGETIAPEELLAHLRTRLETGPGVAPEQNAAADAATSFSTYMRSFETENDGETLLEALDLDVTRATAATAFGEFQFNFGDCQADLLVLHFADDARVLELSTVSCSG